MAAPVSFEVDLDIPGSTCVAGDIVEGEVTLVLHRPTRAKGVILEVQGQSSVKWQEVREVVVRDRVGPPNERTELHIIDVEDYQQHLNMKVPLVLSRDDEGNLTSGDHHIRFSFNLPTDLPSSLEAEYGHVRYKMTAVVQRPWASDFTATRDLTVVFPVDLNGDPKLAERRQASKEKRFWCLWCSSPPLALTLRLPVGGVVPGHTLVPSVEVDNASRVKVDVTKLVLIQAVTYKAEGKILQSAEILAEKELGSVTAGTSVTWDEVMFEIPPDLPPSPLRHCAIMDLNYCMQLECIPTGPHTSVSTMLELIVGTVPLQEHFTGFIPPPCPPNLGWNLPLDAPTAAIQEFQHYSIDKSSDKTDDSLKK